MRDIRKFTLGVEGKSKMQRSKKVNIKKLFSIICEAIIEEEKELKEEFKRYPNNPHNCYLYGKGIAALYERDIQYILFMALLRKSPFHVYEEVPYRGRNGNKRRDLVLFFPESNKQIWIEMKVLGWSEWYTEGQYRNWLKTDAKKLGRPKERIERYLLVTSVESERPDDAEWKEWFEKNLAVVKFNPSLFRSFKTVFSTGEKFETGYYTISMLKVR